MYNEDMALTPEKAAVSAENCRGDQKGTSAKLTVESKV